MAHWGLLRQNKQTRKIFGTKKDEVTGNWKKLHNEQLHDWYSTHQPQFGWSNQEE